MPVICGLDLATNSGIALFDGDTFLHAEAFRAKGETHAERFHRFRTHLRATLVAFGVEHAALEAPLQSGLTRNEVDKETGNIRKVPSTTMQTLEFAYGMRAIASEVLWSLNIHPHEVHQGSWRKAFFRDGIGKATSEERKKMALAQCQLLRWPVTSADAAEACGVAWWLAGQLQLHNGALPGDLFCNVA